jgi:hypothetical protein
MKSTPYKLINCCFYKIEPDYVLRICILEHEREIIIEESYSSLAGGHFNVDTTNRKILQVGLW